MIDPGCATTRSHLPELLAGALAGNTMEELTHHLAGCEDCQAEAALLEALRRHRPMLPPTLEPGVLAALDAAAELKGAPHRWPLATAAAAVLVLAGGLYLGQVEEPELEVAGVEYMPPFHESLAGGLGDWPGADGVLAGGLVLPDLSVEELEQLLVELDS